MCNGTKVYVISLKLFLYVTCEYINTVQNLKSKTKFLSLTKMMSAQELVKAFKLSLKIQNCFQGNVNFFYLT
jgi:hypothetical protein